jgi:hypothetical protein
MNAAEIDLALPAGPIEPVPSRPAPIEAGDNRPEVCRAGLFHSVCGAASFRCKTAPFVGRNPARK